jgi:ABC-type multidrug transport system ATPase subunit
MSMIGYCPQFDAINDQLTGKESLELMAILRGISPLKTKKHVDKWIKRLGRYKYTYLKSWFVNNDFTTPIKYKNF